MDYQLERLAYIRTLRLEVLRNGYLLSNVKAVKADRSGIEIHAKGSNITKGHNTPTGFTGEGPYEAKVELLAQMFPINLITTFRWLVLTMASVPVRFGK